jgi:hypothetical protein
LPRNAALRRINELVKRTRSVKVHAHIIHYLRKQMPKAWGKREKQERLVGRLEREFVNCARRYNLPRGDFPHLGKFRAALMEIGDISKFPKLDKGMVRGRVIAFFGVVLDLADSVRMEMDHRLNSNESLRVVLWFLCPGA